VVHDVRQQAEVGANAHEIFYIINMQPSPQQ
jgi:hypothetical protein